ncbi:hypothetical protein ACJW30_02G181500 [Castanea mollissima]
MCNLIGLLLTLTLTVLGSLSRKKKKKNSVRQSSPQTTSRLSLISSTSMISANSDRQELGRQNRRRPKPNINSVSLI